MPPYAEVCLRALVREGLGESISIGGALGLLYYLDYRATRDVDAWWIEAIGAENRHRVIEVIQTTLAQIGEVRIRAWGDVVSIELRQAGQTIFSFQLARRSAQLEPPALAPGLGVLLDSFVDLVASKMTALVERGAPRDFRDIFMVCESGLTQPRLCWQWWRLRQIQAGSDANPERACLAIETHLARIERHRPLDHIASAEDQLAAAKLRQWFKRSFIHCGRSKNECS